MGAVALPLARLRRLMDLPQEPEEESSGRKRDPDDKRRKLVTLTAAERESLFEDAIALYAQEGAPVGPDFRELCDLCAMQRLMQALGAYGFLGLVKEHSHFLTHIPAALTSLREITARIPGLEHLRRLLDRMQPVQ